MKQLFLLFAMFCAIHVYSQETYQIKSMSECGNDTIEYIKTNFVRHEDRYIGQPFGKFLDDIKLGIYFLGFPVDSSSNIWVLRMSYMRGGDDMLYYFRNIPYYDFIVEFEPPYVNRDEVHKRYHGALHKMTGEIVRKCIVKDMKFYYHLKDYTEPKNNGYWKGVRMN